MHVFSVLSLLLIFGGPIAFVVMNVRAAENTARRRMEILTYGYVERATKQTEVDPITYLVEHYDSTSHREQEAAILNAIRILRERKK